MQSPPNILLVTGKPGSGKTTLISKVYDLLLRRQAERVSPSGFITRELRRQTGQMRNRYGFDVVLLGTEVSSALARTPDTCCCQAGGDGEGVSTSGHRVGSYVVQVASFERLALPCLQTAMETLAKTTTADTVSLNVCIIDEIGKMELKSVKFEASVRRLVDGVTRQRTRSTILLATIPASGRGLPLVDDICKRPGVRLFELTVGNRDQLVETVYDAIIDRL